MDDKEKTELKNRREFMKGLPFCPDHRDKMRGLSCRQCEIDRLTRINAMMEEALEQFLSCNLTEDNCASLEVANSRIRNIAKKGLRWKST